MENALGCAVHSVCRVVPELQDPLDVGDQLIRMARYAPYNPIARHDTGPALVLGAVTDTPAELRAGRASRHVGVHRRTGQHRTLPPSCALAGHGLLPRLQGPLQFVMQRRMMHGIKERAEGTCAPSAADVLLPLSWTVPAAAAGMHAARVLRERENTWRGAAWGGVAGAAGVVLFARRGKGPHASRDGSHARGQPAASGKGSVMNRPPRRHAVAAVSGATLLILGVREALLLRDADLTAARGRARQLGLARLLAGVLLLARPQLLSGALGLSTAGAPAQWLPRLVAVREVAVGVGALASSGSNADPWPWLMTIAAVDGAEAAVLAAALGRRALDPAGGWAFLAADLGSASALLPHLKRLLSR